jgi:MiaB-like tRNA modifying enzyme
MKVLVKSFGCSANLADGQVLAGCLEEGGYRIVDSVQAADLVIYNTCAVKEPTENRVIQILKAVPEGKKVIVAGCLPLINPERLQKETHFDGVVGPAAGCRIVEVVKRVLAGEKVVDLKGALNAKPMLDLPRSQSNPLISILPVSYGCLGECAYCCVVFARGRLRSYEISEIVERARKDLASGAREFWITSQDTACYGKDRGTDLAELLNALCSVEGDFRIRVGMMTPNMALELLDRLIEAFKDEKIFKFFHLPVQSGDDETLKRMRRFYTIKDFKVIVNAFRKTFPEITLATDIICGFPGESREAFEKSLQLINDVQPEIVNVSKFFARPRTEAAKMQDSVSLPEIKHRSSAAAELVRKIASERNQRWVGWKGEILIDEIGKLPHSWIGRNFAYKPVAIKSSSNLFGKTLRVKIIRAFSTYLEGVISE